MRAYSVAAAGVNLGVGPCSGTLIQVKVPATTAICLTRAWVSQAVNAISAQFRVSLDILSTVSTVTSQTPVKLGSPNDASSLCVGGAAATGIAGTVEGAVSSSPIEDDFNVLNGWLFIPVPEERIWIPPSTILALRIPANVPTSNGWGFGLNFLEV